MGIDHISILAYMLSIYPLDATFGPNLLPIIKGSLYSLITTHISQHCSCELITTHDIICHPAQSAAASESRLLTSLLTTF